MVNFNVSSQDEYLRMSRLLKYYSPDSASLVCQIACRILALFPFDSPTTDYSLDFTQHWVLVPIPFCARLAVSLFPACATAPCNQRRLHQHVGIFPKYGENAVTRRAQYGHTEHGREWNSRCYQISHMTQFSRDLITPNRTSGKEIRDGQDTIVRHQGARGMPEGGFGRSKMAAQRA